MKNCIALCALFFFSSTLPLSDMGLGQTKAVVKERMLNRLQYEMNIIKKLPGAVKRCVKAKGQCSDEDQREISAGMKRISFVITLLAVLVPATYGIYKRRKKRLELPSEKQEDIKAYLIQIVGRSEEKDLRNLFSTYRIPRDLLNELFLVAVAFADPAIVAYLITQGGNPAARDLNGKPVIMTAISRAIGASRELRMGEVLKVIKVLIGAGLDPNIRSVKGLTPLMHAASNDLESVVFLLLQNKADKKLKDDDGWSAYNYATENKASPAVINLVNPSF